MSDNAIKSTTQEFLDVYDIVNDMVLLKDGTAAVILQIGTMNFSLLAEQEQDAVIFTYGSLLNSLNYQIQINIQSQTKDATKYLRLLDEQMTEASSDRKANLIKKYRDFVAALIKERNVLQKRFYITVPAIPGEMGLISASGVLPGKTAFDINTVEKSILLEKAINILEPRKDHLTSQFNRLGLYVRQLTTQEIIQNFYINYNPEAAEGQEISSSENYTTPLVRASFGGKHMQANNQQDNSSQIPVITTPVQAQANDQMASSEVYPTPEEILSGEEKKTEINQTTTPVQNQEAPALINTTVPSPVSNPTPAVQDPTIDLTQAQEPTLNMKSSEPQVVQQNSQGIPSNQEVLINPALDANTVPEVMTSEQIITPSIEQTTSTLETNNVNNALESNQEINPEINLSLDPTLISTNPSEEKIELPKIFADDNQAMATNPAQQPVAAPSQETVTQEPNNQDTEAMNDFAEEITPLQNNFDAQTQNQGIKTEPQT